MEHECTIGLWSDYDYSPLVTLSDLVEMQPDSIYTMTMLTDNRYNTCLTRFTHCPWCGWFCWEKKFENLMMHSVCRRKVLENLYWLVGRDCDIAEWSNRIDNWDRGRGVDGKTNKESVFFNIDDKITALESFNNI